jgi:hypothetical protein
VRFFKIHQHGKPDCSGLYTKSRVTTMTETPEYSFHLWNNRPAYLAISRTLF